MAIMKVVLGYENQLSGASWTLTNWVDVDNPNLARAAADDWNDAYMVICPTGVQLKFCKVITNPLPGGIHVHVNYPASSFGSAQGGVIGGRTVADNLYMLLRGSGNSEGGQSYWKLHGADISKRLNQNLWVSDTETEALRVASLAYFNQYRRVATAPWAGPGDRHRGLQVISPPKPFPVMDLSVDMYAVKTGRSFALPGVERR